MFSAEVSAVPSRICQTLNGAAEGQDPKRNRDEQISENRREKQFLAIDKVRQRAGEQTKSENRDALSQSGKP